MANEIAKVRRNLGDKEKLLIPEDEDIQEALDDENGDVNCATGRILENIATTKALSAKRISLGNKTVEEVYEDCLKMAKFWRGKAGEETGNLPPMVGVHTDGEKKDGRPEFPDIGIEDVEEGLRSDTEIKPSDGTSLIEE